MTPSTASRVWTNALANWAGFAAQLAVAFFLAPVLVHGLGDRRYGIWSLIESVLAYLLLFDLGVAAAVVRYVARFEAAQDRAALNRVFNTSLCAFAAAGAAALLVALALAFPGFGLLAVPPDLADEARWMLVLLGANLALGLPLSVYPSVLDGLGRYPAKAAVRTALLGLRVALFLIVVGRGGGLVPLAASVTACNLLEHLALAVAAHCYLPGLRLAPRLADRETFRLIRGYSVDAFVAMVAGRVSFQTDALVIGTFLAPEPITFFAVAARLVEKAKDSLRAATTVLTPAVSRLEARGDAAAIRRVLVDGTRTVLWLTLPIPVGFWVLGRPFLHLWMGPRYAEVSYPTLAILAAPLALVLAQSVSGRILYGTGRLRWFARAQLAEAGANLALSLALVRPLGIEGVALGTAVPSLLFNAAVAVYICRTLGVRLADYVRHAFLRPLLAAGLLAAGWAAAVGRTEPAGWPALLAVGGLGLAAYLAVAALVEWGPTAFPRGKDLGRGLFRRLLPGMTRNG